MIELYLNQAATWKQKTGNDGRGRPIFAPGKAIRVRWTNRRRLITKPDGAVIESNAEVLVKEEVGPEDVLVFGSQEWRVIDFLEVPDVNGKPDGRKVAV